MKENKYDDNIFVGISGWQGLVFYPTLKSKGFYLIECFQQVVINETIIFIDKFLILTYNNITNTCKTTTQSIVKEESLWQNRY